jgi:hypothetical protein
LNPLDQDPHAAPVDSDRKDCDRRAHFTA